MFTHVAQSAINRRAKGLEAPPMMDADVRVQRLAEGELYVRSSIATMETSVPFREELNDRIWRSLVRCF